MNQTERLGTHLERFQRGALILGVVGVVVTVIGFFINSAQFFQSYLFGYIFWVQLALGCLGLVMIHHLAGGNWGFMIRRILEASGRTLPLLAILFIPILFGLPAIFEWARPEVVAADELLQHKSPYLNVPFFIGRTVVYFVIWGGIAYLLSRWSAQYDESPDRAGANRIKMMSGPALGLLGLTATFASFDWMMSLEPHWFSTIYGMMFVTGMAATAFPFAIIILAWLSKYKPLADVVTPNHFNDLGNFLLAAVMMWAYLSFSQYLIIWAGDLPEETPWYLHRLQGGWQFIGILLIVLHFALPFLILLSRTAKRRVRTLTGVAGIVIVMRAVDLFWLIAPAFHPGRLYLPWLDLAALVGVGGLWGAAFLWLLRQRPIIPRYDLRIVEEEEVSEHGRSETANQPS